MRDPPSLGLPLPAVLHPPLADLYGAAVAQTVIPATAPVNASADGDDTRGPNRKGPRRCRRSVEVGDSVVVS
jgi:hypothetical protein